MLQLKETPKQTLEKVKFKFAYRYNSPAKWDIMTNDQINTCLSDMVEDYRIERNKQEKPTDEEVRRFVSEMIISTTSPISTFEIVLLFRDRFTNLNKYD